MQHARRLRLAAGARGVQGTRWGSRRTGTSGSRCWRRSGASLSRCVASRSSHIQFTFNSNSHASHLHAIHTQCTFNSQSSYATYIQVTVFPCNVHALSIVPILPAELTSDGRMWAQDVSSGEVLMQFDEGEDRFLGVSSSGRSTLPMCRCLHVQLLLLCVAAHHRQLQQQHQLQQHSHHHHHHHQH